MGKCTFIKQHTPLDYVSPNYLSAPSLDRQHDPWSRLGNSGRRASTRDFMSPLRMKCLQMRKAIAQSPTVASGDPEPVLATNSRVLSPHIDTTVHLPSFQAFSGQEYVLPTAFAPRASISPHGAVQPPASCCRCCGRRYNLSSRAESDEVRKLATRCLSFRQPPLRSQSATTPPVCRGGGWFLCSGRHRIRCLADQAASSNDQGCH
jgi:hypothetical protein